MNTIKILIADDHQIVLDGLKTLIGSVPEFEVVAAARDGKAVLEIANLLTIDVVLMDIDMPMMNGIETTVRLMKTHPKIKVLALSMHNEKAIIEKILDSGAMGYIFKNVDKEELITAIKTVNSGKKYLCTATSFSLLKNEGAIVNFATNQIKADELTKREIEILKLVAKGFSSRAIGEKLFISPRTVDKHRANILDKLNVKSIADIVHYCIKNNLLE